MENRPGTTTTGEMRHRTRREIASAPSALPPQLPIAIKKPRRGEELWKNLAVASALLICLVALRSGAVPSASDLTDAVLTAATGDTLLDDRLGKLSFVSSLFPEATLVFGMADSDAIALPVSGGSIVHAWSEEEPYIFLSSTDGQVFSPMDGEVLGVYHGENEELLVQIRRADGVSCICGNLAEAAVQTGDAVSRGDPLGTLGVGHDCAFELLQDGYSIDPTSFLSSAA